MDTAMSFPLTPALSRREREFWNRLLGLWAVLLLPAGQANGMTAETGTIHSATSAGLTVSIDTRWLDSPGYRPVRITVAPTVPTSVDRTLTVQMDVRPIFSRSPETHRPRVVQDIELPAGFGVVETTLLVPGTLAWSFYRINVFENGKLLPRLAFTHSPGNPIGYAEAAIPNILIVADAQPDTQQLTQAWPEESVFGQGMRGKILPGQTPSPLQFPTAIARPSSALPSQWLEYSSLDIVFISMGELTALAEKDAARCRALLQWLRAGGNLWVYGLGDAWERLPALESLVGFPPHADSPDTTPTGRGWREPEKGLFLRPIQGVDSNVDWMLANDPNAQNPANPSSPTPPDLAPFVFRNVEMGQVVAMAAANPFPGNKDHWRWLFNATFPRWQSYQRHGLSAIRDNVDFWNLLIPGIGLAPVTAFLVLISLFALLIGPVNYLLLRRWKRLHWMLVTTPAAAAAVTVALFAYAVIADGLGTRIRMRSVTCLDQRQGQAVCWARLSYYAGLAPSDGLRFPTDTAVFPLEYSPPEAADREQQLVWLKDQWLSSGWLTSRRPTQFLTIRSRPSSHKLEISPAADKPETLSIKNRLGTRIEQALIRAKDGKYYWIADLGPGDTAETGATDVLLAGQRLQKVFVDHQPAFPPSVDPQSLETNRRYWRPWYVNQTSCPAPTQSTSFLETALRSPRVSDTTSDPRRALGSYLAVVQRSPEVELGTPKAEEQASFHVILGTW